MLKVRKDLVDSKILCTFALQFRNTDCDMKRFHVKH